MKLTKYMAMAAVALASVALSACSDDEPDTAISVIPDENVEATPFDAWLQHNFNLPYNIDFKYRYEDVEGDFDYYLVPARYEDAITMAHMIKYLCVETYNEVAGTDFTRRYFPKMFYTVGQWEYRNNGTFVLGTAEGGRKIFLTGLNDLPLYRNNMAMLNHYYFKTIHHEFTHILNQTKPIPSDFQLVTLSGYVADNWNAKPFNSEYLQNGFISAYAQHSYTEDFAEMLSIYITNSRSYWDSVLAQAPASAAAAIEQKLDIVRQYMLDSFNINIDELREVVQRRQSEVGSGKVDLDNLDID